MCRSRCHWLFSVAAVFLLLFTAVDLAYPQMCAEDGDNDSTLAVGNASVNTIAVATADSHDTAPVHTDDCFCCCGHVIAGAIFHVPVPKSAVQSRFTLTAHRVIATPPAAFHPPRLA